MGVSLFIHVVFLLVRFSAVAPFVWPLPDSLLVQWIKDFLRESVASGGGDMGELNLRKVLRGETHLVGVLIVVGFATRRKKPELLKKLLLYIYIALVYSNFFMFMPNA